MPNPTTEQISTTALSQQKALIVGLQNNESLAQQLIESQYPGSGDNLDKLRESLNLNYSKYSDEVESNTKNITLEQAKMNLKELSKNTAIANTLNTTLDELKKNNLSKIGGLNADTMTAKRVGTLYSQRLIRTRNICDNLKISMIFLCFMSIILFCSSEVVGKVIPFSVAEWVFIILILVLCGILISRGLSNLNRYHMLTQERVFTYEPTASSKAANTCLIETGIDPNQELDVLKDGVLNLYDKAVHTSENARASITSSKCENIDDSSTASDVKTTVTAVTAATAATVAA